MVTSFVFKDFLVLRKNPEIQARSPSYFSSLLTRSRELPTRSWPTRLATDRSATALGPHLRHPWPAPRVPCLPASNAPGPAPAVLCTSRRACAHDAPSRRRALPIGPSPVPDPVDWPQHLNSLVDQHQKHAFPLSRLLRARACPLPRPLPRQDVRRGPTGCPSCLGCPRSPCRLPGLPFLAHSLPL